MYVDLECNRAREKQMILRKYNGRHGDAAGRPGFFRAQYNETSRDAQSKAHVRCYYRGNPQCSSSCRKRIHGVNQQQYEIEEIRAMYDSEE